MSTPPSHHSPPNTPRLPPSERIRRAGVVAWSIIGLLILGGAGVWALYRIRVIFPPLVLALLIIYLLNPVVNRLEERRVNRTLGTILAYVVVLGSLFVLIVAITPVMQRQVENFSEDWPRFKDRLIESVEEGAAGFNRRFNADIDVTQVLCILGADEETDTHPLAPTDERCDRVAEDFRELIGAQADRITDLGSSVLEVLLILILGPLLALYLLIDLPHLGRDTLSLVPETHRDEFADLGSKIGRAVGGFFRGQLVVALIVGIMSTLGFLLIGLPFALVIGAIAGFTNLIPLVGPFIGGGLGFLVGTLSDGFGLGLKAGIVALIVQQIDNHVISPNVMRRTVQLHPVTVMLSLLAGGAVLGFWGVLLAVPAVAVAKLLLSHLWQTRVLGVEPSPFAQSPGADPPSVVPEPEREQDVTASPPED
jgi:predicted PurR-regulated permease PerM